MDKFYTLSLALENIEARIPENNPQADIAAASMVSLFSLQSALAAGELLADRTPIAEPAGKCGCAPTEAFSRVKFALLSDYCREKEPKLFLHRLNSAMAS